jgi:hypothetical protein
MDSPKADQFEGESTIYVDDFEVRNLPLICVLRILGVWHPLRTKHYKVLYDFNANANDLSYGFKRGNSWYSIDPVFLLKNRLEFQMKICHLKPEEF